MTKIDDRRQVMRKAHFRSVGLKIIKSLGQPIRQIPDKRRCDFIAFDFCPNVISNSTVVVRPIIPLNQRDSYF